MRTFNALVFAVALAACKDGSGPEPDVHDARIDTPSDTPPDTSSLCFAETGTPAGCFDPDLCEQSALTDFLNACTDGTCLPFDNVARLPRYDNGNLPALP